jgi:hypothetical protein
MHELKSNTIGRLGERPVLVATLAFRQKPIPKVPMNQSILANSPSSTARTMSAGIFWILPALSP